MNVKRDNNRCVKFCDVRYGNSFETSTGDIFMKTEYMFINDMNGINAVSFDGKFRFFRDEAMVKLLDAEVVVKN